MFVANIRSDFTFENSENFVIRKHIERYFRNSLVLHDKVVAMVTPDSLGNQKYLFFLVLHGKSQCFSFLLLSV